MFDELLAENIAAHWLQAGVLATSAVVAMRLLRLNEPRASLAALHLALIAIVVLPLVQPWRTDEPALQMPSVATMEATVADISSDTAAGNGLVAAAWIDPNSGVVAILAVGLLVRLLWLISGVIRLARFSRRALDVSPPTVAGELQAALQVSPRYIEQTGSRGPWTFGFLRATVALPAGFDALVPAFQRAIICHELLHVKRRDMAVAFVEELAVAALWFHPWIWLLRARIRVAREQVVDGHVVTMLGNRDEYVRCLVDISGHDLAPHFSQAGAGMLRPRELRARVDAIFQEARMSRRHLVFVTLALMMAVGATTYVAGAALPMRSPAIVDYPSPIGDPQALVQDRGMTVPTRLEPAIPGPRSWQFKDARLSDVLAFIGQATNVVFTGYEASFDEGRSVTIATTAELEPLLDRLLTPNGLMYTVTGPRTVVIARSPLAELRQATRLLEAAELVRRRQINTVYAEYPQEALERGIKGVVLVDITVNPAGEVTTAAVASGPQELRASAFKAALGLKYTKAQSTTAIQITFEYVLTDTSWGVKINGALPNIDTKFFTVLIGDTVAKVPSPDASGALRVGGSVQPPKKLKDVPPVYPPAAQEARVQGVVIIEARIDESGSVSDTRVLRSIPLLDEAATDAVKQWQYTPTLMNGVAVPVIMTVTVNFTLRSQVQLSIAMPDGSLVLLRVNPNGEIGRTEHPAMGRFGFAPVLDRDPSVDTVKVTIYEFDDAGNAARPLGDVELRPGGGLVQSATTPSFGIALVSISR